MALILEQFILNLRESRLIPAEEVASLEKALQGSKTPRSSEDVAKLLIKNGKLTEYQAATISQGRHQNLILGEYVLLNILGKGGMGVVFRARHRLMDRVVALKTLPTAAIKPDSVQRFYREVKAAARLAHRNIVTAYDAGEHAGTHYLVMEYVVGRDLAKIVREKGPLPLREAIDYVQQAARGLEFAHTHGVVHRDVKPSNLLLDRQGVVKILDMGLARLNEDLAGAPGLSELTGTGQIMGTVDYMSPEQAEDVRLADQRSDIYSLGCTLFYLLTRRPVYGGDTILRRILSHRDEPIPSVTEIRPDCPAALDAAIRWMLAKRPDDRPQAMAEIIVALENCLEKPGAAPPLAAQNLEAINPVHNWLEDLAHEGATSSTEDSEVQQATMDSTPAKNVSSETVSASAGGSSASRSKQQLHLLEARTSASADRGRKRRKVVFAAAAAAVITGVAVLVVIFNRAGSNTTAEEDSIPTPKTSAATVRDDARTAGYSAPTLAPKQPTKGPEWEESWTAAMKQADRLVAQRQFAKAIGEYTTLAARFQDPQLQQRCNAVIRRIEEDADVAFGQIETAARNCLRQRQFAKARAAVQPALATFGPVPATSRARKLIVEINQAESQAVLKVEKPVETSKVQETPALSPELLKQRQLDAAFSKAMVTVEGRVAAWNFRGAIQELEKMGFDSPELSARAASRREQIERMANLKDRMIAEINQADPRLTKADLSLRGINGELNKADAEAITATLPNGKEESLVWSEVAPKAMLKLLQTVMHRDDAGDWLAAGLLSLTCQDVPSAEQCFDKARSLGAETAPCRALLATRDFAAVQDLLEKHKYAESGAILTALEEKYGKLPWFAANKLEFDAAAKESRRGLHENEAEGLYAQAAGLFRDGELYELKPVVERLKTQYADSAVAADSQRKPSLAELAKKVADLGPLIRVRKDGKGDAKTIQEAVKNAAGNATIQIEEIGPWTEQIVVPADKDALTICGKRGLMPVLTTVGLPISYAETILVRARQLSLRRLAIARADLGLQFGIAISAETTSVALRGVAVHGHTQLGTRAVAKDCVFSGRVAFRASGSLEDVLVGGALVCGPDSQLRHCTIVGPLHLNGMSSTVFDCVLPSINAPNDGHKIEHCDVFGVNPFMNRATPGRGCIKTPPLFADPKSFDFRLQVGSPCRKAGSDGSDMGLLYTPEIQALLKVAADLRNRARGKL